GEHDVRHAADSRRHEDARESRQDGRAILLGRPEHEREYGEKRAEGEEVERGDGDDQEPCRPRLLLLQLDRQQLQARAHRAPSATVVCISPSFCLAMSSCVLTFDFTSASRLSPSACTVFRSSWASETTFWMSRAIGLVCCAIVFGWVVLRISVSFGWLFPLR